MARDTDTAYKLDKPEKLNDLLKADGADDCGSCRVIGGGAFLALGAYSYFSGMSQIEQQRAKIIASKSLFGVRSRKTGIVATSLGLAWMGIYRLFM
ncbi:hypothetical protein JX265_004359 [Neoarthrinium moseri]|uniref:Distal membrane-arm assembly complex protein 1-like domain-containing protein n=1 Tax=Neoarthrinium moseri TaxID=1658444 RepID=A0A9P9WQU8_9PEZI|nr:uncharacterized protein JN550_001847 [Neoarthrinium moseri]KAI1850649.1 hypothetical protein JX266_003931 [Neoarthrinium moseri]KAI1875301.1 hypothetical protein JX265_004359 [Neoarthrinium moseri]KAI1875561.1 hypothetical protein JN550_001847 [Neoarthrinium moseri]